MAPHVRFPLILAALAMVFAGCPSGDPEPAGAVDTTDVVLPTPDDRTAMAPDPRIRTCTREDVPYTVSFPGMWHTNDGDVMEPCSLFDPDPIVIEPATEVPHDIAITIRVEDVPFERVTSAAPGAREVQRHELTVDDRPAVRQEIELTEARLRPAGARTYSYFVDLGGRTLVAQTHDAGELAFRDKKDTLSEMMETLYFGVP
jgi:hypothetical protein